MSEQQPLLVDRDAEYASAWHGRTGTLASMRENTAHFLESRLLHKAVIALARINILSSNKLSRFRACRSP